DAAARTVRRTRSRSRGKPVHVWHRNFSLFWARRVARAAVCSWNASRLVVRGALLSHPGCPLGYPRRTESSLPPVVPALWGLPVVRRLPDVPRLAGLAARRHASLAL